MARKKPEISLRVRAMQYLARREYSRAELRRKLLPHMHVEEESGAIPIEELDALLDDLAARGYLSDIRATAQFLDAKRNRFGTQRIAHELRQKGIDEELIGAALQTLKEGEFDAVREVWQKKFGVFPVDQKEKARQIRFLQSRGFSLESIFKVIGSAGSDDQE